MKNHFNSRKNEIQGSLISFPPRARLPLLLPILLMVLMVATVAQATDVLFNFTDFTQGTSFFSATNVVLEMKPYVNGATVYNGQIILPDAKRFTNSATGTLTISNVVPVVHTVTLTAKNTTLTLRIDVIDTNVTINAREHIISATNSINGGTGSAYSVASMNSILTGYVQASTNAILYVDSAYGSDSTGRRGRSDKPFFSGLAAATNASPGDTVWFRPGTYNNGTNNILRRNVHYHTDEGSLNTWSNGTATAAIQGLFDDRFTGPTTNYITGRGMYFCTAENTDTGEANFNLRGMLVQTNARSEIHFQAGYVAVSAPNSFGSQGFFAALHLISGLTFADVPWINDIYVTDGEHSSGAIGVYWAEGEQHLNCPRITMQNNYGIWGEDPNPGSSQGNFWFTGDTVISTNFVSVYVKSSQTVSSPNFKTWLFIKEARSGSSIGYSFLGLSKIYLNGQKSSGTPAIDSGASAWIQIQKVSGAGNMMTLRGGENFVNVMQWDDTGVDGGTDGTARINVLAGVNEINGGSYRANQTNGTFAVQISGGTNTFRGFTADMRKSQRTNAWGFLDLGTNANALTLEACRVLVTGATTNSIYATNAQTVTLVGPLTISTNVHPNVTLSGGLTVNNKVIYGDGSGLTNIAAASDGTAITNLVNTRGTESTNFARGTIGLALTNAISGATNVLLHTNTLRAGNAITITNAGISRIDIAVTPGFFAYAFVNKVVRFFINSGSATSFTAVGDVATIATFGTAFSIVGDSIGPASVGMPTAASINSQSSVSGNPNYRVGKGIESAAWGGVTNTATAFTYWHVVTDQAASVVTGTNPNGNYAGFRYNTTGDSTYKFITKDASTQTITDTLVALGNSFHSTYIYEDVAGSRWIGYIDGVAVATNTTHLPTTATQLRYVVSATTDANSTNCLRVAWGQHAAQN